MVGKKDYYATISESMEAAKRVVRGCEKTPEPAREAEGSTENLPTWLVAVAGVFFVSFFGSGLTVGLGLLFQLDFLIWLALVLVPLCVLSFVTLIVAVLREDRHAAQV